ncbi:MAG: TraG/TraD/VirD4 family protein [Frankiaceae bacterium]|nr:TraG/TraD/VirD4 family protein [Frankiaceae bacterium]
MSRAACRRSTWVRAGVSGGAGRASAEPGPVRRHDPSRVCNSRATRPTRDDLGLGDRDLDVLLAGRTARATAPPAPARRAPCQCPDPSPPRASPHGRATPSFLACLDELPSTTPLPTPRVRRADERALGPSLIYAAQTWRQMVVCYGEDEARSLFGLTNNIVVFSGG